MSNMGKLQKAALEAYDKIKAERGEVTFIDAYIEGHNQAKAEDAELIKLADAMYHAAFNMTTDASKLGEAMRKYNQYRITHL